MRAIDYKTHSCSSIFDAVFNVTFNETQMKLYVWYDNEWGYANRTANSMRIIYQMDKQRG